MNMDRPTSFIKDIMPDTPQPWTVKVMVVERAPAREARSSPAKFQRLVVMDSENTRVQVTLFNKDINTYHDVLELFGTYYISNAYVTSIPAKYQTTSFPYQWSLNTRCLVEQVIGDGIIPPVEYAFLPISSIPNQYLTLPTVDMLFVVLKVLPKKKLSPRAGGAVFQEMIVVDKGLIPVILTAWDHFVDSEVADITSIINEKPIIVALRLKVSVYDGLSLSTKSVTSLQINPAIGPLVALQSWLIENILAVDNLLGSPDLESVARNFGKEVTSQLRQISYISSHSSIRFVYVRCRLRLLDEDQEIMRTCCPNSTCNGTTSALPGCAYTCHLCGTEVVCIASVRLNATAEDSTGSLPVTLFARDAAMFLGCQDELDLLTKIKGVNKPLQTLKNNVNVGEVTIRLKAQNYTQMGIPSRRFVATFTHGMGVHEEIAGTATTLNATDPLQLLGALQSAPIQETLQITPEEKEMLEKIFSRQPLKGKLQEPIMPDLCMASSESCPGTTAKVHGKSHLPAEIDYPKINANLDVPLEDEEQWQLLMAGPAAVESENLTLSDNTMTKKQEGKDRAAEIDKDSNKSTKKLFQENP